MLKTSASLWSTDLMNIERDLLAVDEIVDKYHVDVMDNHYVKNMLFGADFIKAIKRLTNRPVEVHFMVENVEDTIDDFVEAGADILILHLETFNDYMKVIDNIKNKGKGVGLAVKVEEDIECVYPYLEKLDTVVLMGTKLGIKGAGFEPNIYNKISQLSAEIRKRGQRIDIQIDGGIRYETVPKMIEKGAQVITAGSILFNDIEKFRIWRENL